jgi:hypothetical protein
MQNGLTDFQKPCSEVASKARKAKAAAAPPSSPYGLRDMAAASIQPTGRLALSPQRRSSRQAGSYWVRLPPETREPTKRPGYCYYELQSVVRCCGGDSSR